MRLSFLYHAHVHYAHFRGWCRASFLHFLSLTALQYSKSSRAKCHGPPPCKGSPIALGDLRYGQVKLGAYGETVEWRHW